MADVKEKATSIVNDLKVFIESALEAKEIPTDVIRRVADYSKEDMLTALINVGLTKAINANSKVLQTNMMLNSMRGEAALQGKELTRSQEIELLDKTFSGKQQKRYRDELKSDKYQPGHRESITEGQEIGD